MNRLSVLFGHVFNLFWVTLSVAKKLLNFLVNVQISDIFFQLYALATICNQLIKTFSVFHNLKFICKTQWWLFEIDFRPFIIRSDFVNSSQIRSFPKNTIICHGKMKTWPQQNWHPVLFSWSNTLIYKQEYGWRNSAKYVILNTKKKSKRRQN